MAVALGSVPGLAVESVLAPAVALALGSAPALALVLALVLVLVLAAALAPALPFQFFCRNLRRKADPALMARRNNGIHFDSVARRPELALAPQTLQNAESGEI